jgi:hypothetical protein
VPGPLWKRSFRRRSAAPRSLTITPRASAGDADTLACIAGGIAEPFYGGVPEDIAQLSMARLDDHLRDVVLRFTRRYGDGTP